MKFIQFCKQHRILTRSLQLLGIGLIAFSFWNISYATGTDMLTSTYDNLLTTVNGSGKIIIYIFQFCASVAAYILTQKPWVFGSLVLVSFAYDIFTHFISLAT